VAKKRGIFALPIDANGAGDRLKRRSCREAEGMKVPDAQGEEEGRKKYFNFFLANGKTSLTFATLFGRNGRNQEVKQAENGAAVPVFAKPAECGGRSSLKCCKREKRA
jgi:hypothetical protein